MQIPLQTLQVAQRANTIIGATNQSIQMAAAMDEGPEDQAANQPGQVAFSNDQVEFSLATKDGMPVSFKNTVKTDIATPDGQLISPAGTKSSYQRNEDGSEDFRTETPTGDGKALVTTLNINPAAGVVDYNEQFIIAGQ